MTQTITITKKEARTNFDAITFCVKAKAKEKDHRFDDLIHLQVTKNRVVATDGHRLHIAPVKHIPNGIYYYEKKQSTITLMPLKKGRFPDWEAVMPKTFDHQVMVDKAEFLYLIKMAKIIFTSEYKGITLTFNGNLRVDAVNPDLGTMDAELDIDKSVDPEIKIGINPMYLIDALKSFDKTVTIGLQEKEGSPMIFKDNKGINTALIMPMRV